MFVNCPACGYLVALDHANQPLARCPNCAFRLREEPRAQISQEPAPAEPPVPPVAAPSAGPEMPAASDSAQGDAHGAHAQAHAQPDRADPEPLPAPEEAGIDTALPTEPAVEASVAAEAGPRTATQSPPAPAADDAEASPAHIAMTDASAPGLAETAVEAAAGQVPSAEAESTDNMETAPAQAAEDPLPHEDEGPQAPHPDQAPACPAKIEDAPDAQELEAEPAEDAAALIDAAQPPPPATSAASAAPATAAARIRKVSAVPSFARSKPHAAPVDRRGLLLRCSAIAALSLLLALQLLLSDRARLATDPGWRPLLSSLCTMLHCTLPPWREPRAFHVIERDVRTRQSGVLRVSARIRNDARWPQPWPALQLTFSDANGREVATRVFAPREYLGGEPTQSQLDSGQSAGLAMDVIEPGPQAVAFTFDFK